MGAAKKKKTLNVLEVRRSIHPLEPPSQSRQQQRGRGAAAGTAAPSYVHGFGLLHRRQQTRKTKEPERVWLPHGATTLLPVNLRVEGGWVLCRAQRQEQGGSPPPVGAHLQHRPTADGRRREEETHTLKWTRDWSRRRGGEPPPGGQAAPVGLRRPAVGRKAWALGTVVVAGRIWRGRRRRGQWGLSGRRQVA